jgi:hypothetical protein
MRSVFCFNKFLAKNNKEMITLLTLFLLKLIMGKSWIIIRIIMVLVISSLVLVVGYQPIDNTQQSMSESWMFKGAYAIYEGQIESLSIHCNIDEKIQVTDLRHPRTNPD